MRARPQAGGRARWPADGADGSARRRRRRRRRAGANAGRAVGETTTTMFAQAPGLKAARVTVRLLQLPPWTCGRQQRAGWRLCAVHGRGAPLRWPVTNWPRTLSSLPAPGSVHDFGRRGAADAPSSYGWRAPGRLAERLVCRASAGDASREPGGRDIHASPEGVPELVLPPSTVEITDAQGQLISQRTDEWLELRKNRLTASAFSKAAGFFGDRGARGLRSLSP
eukprot:scaffold412_cov388-Prasinococcus_capsulatus_cf.AAC.42